MEAQLKFKIQRKLNEYMIFAFISLAGGILFTVAAIFFIKDLRPIFYIVCAISIAVFFISSWIILYSRVLALEEKLEFDED
jgi:hypothetical protein